MVFDFLKKKFQDAVAPAAAKAAPPGSQADYEERRRIAEALHQEAKTSEAVAILEQLASDLAGAGNFPLAVAVRHQIHQWQPERADGDNPAADAKKMARQREESGFLRKPALRLDSPVNKVVQASPLLAEIGADEIAGLIGSTSLQPYAKDQVVVEEGSPGDRLYIVTRGLLSVTTAGVGGNRVRVGNLGVGDFFGEVSVLTGKPRAATVTAETEAECLQISSENWGRLSEAHSRLRELLEKAMRERAELSAEAVLDDLRKRRSLESP